ncbi:MAG: primosomal protein N' [Oscillospiraceae bacterium]|nr:primosomal protein N' [Oscillospiraceae bacterium]
MSELKTIRVAVENTALSFDGFFDYALPIELEPFAKIGCRVLVPFGRANVKKIAMIFDFPKKVEVERLKKVTAVLDSEPVMSTEQLELAQFISKTTFCPLYEAVKAQLPSGMHLRLTECYQRAEIENSELLSELSDEQMRIYREIAAATKPIAQKKLLERFGFVDDRVLEDMISKGVISKTDKAEMSASDKTVKTARIIPDFSDEVKLTPKQTAVLETLSDVGEASVKDLCYFTGVTPAVVNSLCKKSIIELYDAEVLRVQEVSDTDRADVSEIELSQTQKDAYNGISELLKTHKPKAALLYGVTGSGKTQVFLKLIGDVVEAGRQAIVMVPEISLTPQTVKTFYKYFGSRVAVLHSGLSIGERFDQHKRIRNGEVSVVVGTRSAVFAPLNNIGIIVMDEEQEGTYKSESSPRYHAREAAKFRCTKNSALLLLSSATPSVDSYHHAKSGRYHLFSMEKRFGAAELPEVTIVDMSERDLALRDSAFSATLLEEIRNNLSRGEQSILLYNRRGYHTIASCADCKQVISCPNCSIALTYHKKNNRMMCHYCGYSTPLETSCPTCGSSRLFYRGQGTQRVEDELSLLFPDARIMRMDMDNTSGKAAHQKQFDAFERGEYDILVGTQMVAKGLNFPNVTLVGVLNADQTLYSNDFRAYERAFSLITQVVGRSGRGEKRGRAIIQTMTPQNPVISLAAQQNYPEFFRQEISARKAMLYPPFCDLCVVGFVSASHSKAKEGADRFVEMIKSKNPQDAKIPLRVLGPSPMNVVKIGGKYRYRLIIKCRNDKTFRAMLTELLKEFMSDKINKDVTVYADLNDVGNM